MQDIKDREIEFGTEIRFKGKVGDLERLVVTIGELPIDIFPRHPIGRTAGIWPWPPMELVDQALIEDIIEGQPRFVLKDINGGIRDPHFHMGDEIVLLDRKKFQVLIKDVAGKLAEKFAGEANYPETLGAIRSLAGVAVTEGKSGENRPIKKP